MRADKGKDEVTLVSFDPLDASSPEPAASNEAALETVPSYTPRLLGGPMMLSARQVADQSGTTLECVNDYWTSMGFQRPEPDALAFTQRDLDVYRNWNELVESGAIDLATSRSLLRANSHLADRLSLWQFEALVEDAVRRLGLDELTQIGRASCRERV